MSPSPDEDEMDVTEFRHWIMQPDQEPFDHSECARRVARMVLEFLLEDPRRALIPIETLYESNGPDGIDWSNPPVVAERGLYDVMKDDGFPLAELSITGYQWGYAVNAARRCITASPLHVTTVQR